MSFNLFDVDLSREDKEDLADQEVQSTLSEIQNEGKAVREIEHTIFARLLNFEQLKSATHAEVQEQYIVSVDKSEENAGEGQIRVRKITDRSGNTRYEMTTKNTVKDGKVEVTIPTTEENFTQIKVLSNLSMLKHRYTFPIKGTDYKWEVDAVPDGNGGYFPWVRAEIEVKSKEDKGGEFPLKAEEVYMKAPLGEMSDEDFKEKTEPLMVKFFKRGNPFVNDGKVVETKLKSEDTVETDEFADTKNTEGEDSAEGESEEAKAARLERDKEASLSVDNITDDKETAELVKTRGDQIKEAKGIKDDEDTDDSGEVPDGDEDTTEGDQDTEETGETSEEGSEDTEKNAEGVVDGKDSDGKEEGWDTPPKDTETSKEGFSLGGLFGGNSTKETLAYNNMVSYTLAATDGKIQLIVDTKSEYNVALMINQKTGHDPVRFIEALIQYVKQHQSAFDALVDEVKLPNPYSKDVASAIDGLLKEFSYIQFKKGIETYSVDPVDPKRIDAILRDYSAVDYLFKDIIGYLNNRPDKQDKALWSFIRTVMNTVDGKTFKVYCKLIGKMIKAAEKTVSKEDFVPCYRLDNGKLALESFEVQMVRPDNVNQDANVVIGEKVELSLAGDDDGYQPDQDELYHAIAPDIYPATDIALESVTIPEGDWVATFTDDKLGGFTGKMPKHDIRTENLFLLEQKVAVKAVDDPRLSKLFGWLFGPKLSYFYRVKGEQAFGASLKPSIYPLPSVLNGSVAANLLKDVVPKLVDSAKELDKAVKAWDDWKSLFYRKVDQLSKEFTFVERVEVARQLALLKVPGVDMGWVGAMKYVSTRTLPMNPREIKIEGIIPSTQAELNQYGHHEVGLNESMINAFRVPALDNIIQTHDFYQMAEYVAGKFRVPIMDAAVMLWHGVFNNHSYIRLFLDKEDEILTNCCYVYAMYGKTLAVIHGDAYATSINPGIINWVPLEPKLY